MNQCPVCETSFEMLGERILVQNCECKTICLIHPYHYEHPWCHEDPAYYLMRPAIAASFTADARLHAAAGADVELKLFTFELWPGVELTVLATSDGRIHNTTVDVAPQRALTAIR